MKNITGIGGFFFRSENPEALKAWYIEELGIDIEGYVWNQQTGPTAFEPFKKDTNHFKSDKQWMLNFRVTDLKTLIADLQAKGIKVEQRDEWNAMSEIETFARVHDPEGNPIELWQLAEEN